MADAEDSGPEPPTPQMAPGMDRFATAADVQLVHVLLLGRESRRPETLQRHTGRPLRLVVQAVARAGEFTEGVVPAITKGTPPPHATLGLLPDAALRDWVAMLLGAAPPAAGWGGFLAWALTAPSILDAIEGASPPAARALRDLAAARTGMVVPPHAQAPAPRITANATPAAEATRRITVIAWDMAHNPVARAHTLAELASPSEAAELVGPVFDQLGGRIWPPVADSTLPMRSFPAGDLRSLVAGAVALADATRCDLVHVGKPRLASLLVGALIRQRTGAPMLLDIDDHELAFVENQAPADFAELEHAVAADPAAFATPRSPIWTRFCATLVGEADGITVSSAALQRAYGGTIIRHARDEALFDPALHDRAATRAEFGYGPEDRVVLFLGTPRQHKGLVQLVEAMERLADPRLALCVIGTIRDMALLGRLRRATARVALHGDQPWSRLPALAGMADAVAILQDPEAAISAWQTPAKLTDALASGVPVIATSVPPLAELAGDAALRMVGTPDELDAALREVAVGTRDGAPGRALFHRELSFAANRPRLAQAQAACLAAPRRETPNFARLLTLLERQTGIALTRPAPVVVALPPAMAQAGGAGPRPAEAAARVALPPSVKPATALPTTTPAERARIALHEARTAEARGDFSAAATLLDAGLKLAPRHADMLSVRARVAFTMGEMALAETHARAALVMRPELTRASIILARIAMAAGRHAEAVDLWGTVPPTDPAYRERLLKCGQLLLGLGRPLEALGEFAEALRRQPADRDALRGAAEATEATGALRSALRRWSALLDVVPEDAAATEAVRLLEQRLTPLPGLASPLRNPWLRDWRGLVEGAIGPGTTAEPSPGLTLMAEGRLRYAVAEAHERRPGELPFYGLWLRTEGGSAEVCFGLDPAAGGLLVAGLRMGIELHAPGRPVSLTLALREPAGSVGRRLVRLQASARRRMACFDLQLDPAEAGLLAAGRLALILRLVGPGALVVLPPQPLCRLEADPAPAEGFESAVLAAAFPAAALPPAAVAVPTAQWLSAQA
ncbi:MAG: glycosyltransferase [Pseudomonadota bacterium]